MEYYSTGTLAKLYGEWLERNGLESMCAFELQFEPQAKPHIAWLQAFCLMWDDAQKFEDDSTLLALKFCEIVRDQLVDDLPEIRRLNTQYAAEGKTGVCATHEFCDANILMEHAFKETMRRLPDCGDSYDAALWSRAWGLSTDSAFEL